MEAFLEHSWETIDPQTWNRLCLQGATNTVFQTYQWHAAWLEEFGKYDGNKIFLVQVNDNGRLIGLAPLMIVKKGSLRILKFIGTGHSDYCDFIYDKTNTAILSEIFKFLSARKSEWDAMALDNIPRESPTAGMINELSLMCGFWPSLYSKHPCPVIIFDPAKELVEELISKKSLNRHYQYFQKKGGYQVLHLKTADKIMPFLEQFFQQHIQRRKAARHQSLFAKEHHQQFYKNLVKSLCPNQWLNFTVLQSQEQCIAFHFGLTYNQRFIWYKPSFDTLLSKYSPGEVLLRELLIYAQGHDFKEFDFSIGDEPFKKRFANHTRQNDSFKIFKSKQDYWVHRGIKLLKSVNFLGNR